VRHDLSGIAERFRIPGRLVSAEPHGSGHINDTYLARFDAGGATTRYILQRINEHVFADPDTLMDNFLRVTSHVRAGLAGQDADRRVLTLIPTRDGDSRHRDPAGHTWRAALFVPGATTHDTTDDPGLACMAARAYGLFLTQLLDLPGPPLRETIPRFHDTPSRMVDLRREIEEDTAGRLTTARDEVDFALRREALTRTLAAGGLPVRTVHNDSKLNNVLVDEATGEGLCVIDLDTVMPGLAAHDFGELVRSATNPVREASNDLSRVSMRMSIFEAVVRGFHATTASWLTTAEVESLVPGALLMAMENGVRFLTDHLSGDRYFKVARPGHNLDRCRVQFALLESIEAQEGGMRRIVSEVFSAAR
jgi:Phosphotransferase enzyme family